MAGVRDNTVTNVVSGGIASFKSVGEVLLKSLKVNFNPIQEGDGDPSPSNIRAISGWTGLNVFHSGKNLLNPTVPISTQSASNPIVNVNSNGSITVSSRDGTFWFARDYIYLPAGTYDFYSIFGDDYASRYILDDDNYTEYSWKNKKTVTLTKTTKLRFKAAMGTEYPITGWLQIFKTEESYGEYLYNGTTIPVSWSDLGTVYGGYVDLIKGKLVSKYGVADIDSFDYSLNTVLTGVDRYVAQKPSNCKNIGNSHSCPNQVSDIYGVEAINEANANYSTWITTIFNGQIIFYVPANTYSSIEDFKTAMSGHKIYYELTTPIEYNIDPITIKSLIGTNNIWSNADTVEAQYCALESLNIYKQRFKSNEPHLQSISGNLISFTTDMIAPLKECKINFLPIQASGTPSPDNVLPISGWTECDLWRTGKNVAHQVGWSTSNVSSSSGQRYTSNGYGTTINTTDPVNSITITQTQAQTDPKNSYKNGYVVYIDDNLIFGEYYRVSLRVTNIVSNPLNISLSNITFCVPSGAQAAPTVVGDRIYTTVHYTQNSSVPGRRGFEIRICGMSCTFSDFMVTPVDDTDITYEQYNGSTTSITLPSTYYGGYVDLITGEGQITHKQYICDGSSDEKWFDNGDVSGFHRYQRRGMGDIVAAQDGKPGIMCDIFLATTNYINNSISMAYYSPGEMTVKTIDWATINDFIAYITEHPFEVIGELREPIPFTLTPTQLKTLKNQNNIWSNTNSTTEVKYWTHGSIADKRKVVWNQWAPPLISDYWNDRSSTETITTFENGIATTQFILLSGSYHTMCTKNSSRTYQNHKYYSRLDCMLNKSVDNMGGDVANIAWSKPFIGNLNEWGTYSTIVTGEQDRNSMIYYPRMTRSGGLQQGTIAKTRNPFVIDLTQMFGEGNEPSTAAEFEALCSRNNIDLTQYHPYDEGTQMYWYF